MNSHTHQLAANLPHAGTPSPSLLTNAGALDYDFESAVCELIDNAIQVRARVSACVRA